jgi:hypothetical protein
MVEELPEELHGRLSSVALYRRHVHIVDENDGRPFGPNYLAASLLLQLRLDGLLRRKGVGLRRERQWDGDQPFGHP